ncbi:MAG: 50S ribosomal protein L16 [archaeon]
MGIRPGHCYNTKKDRAFTRYAVKVHRRSYVGSIPGLKTRQFNMGDGIKQFNRVLNLVADGHAQVRDNALESARMAVNRFLNNKLGKDGYFMKIRVYPFHILRENKLAQGAGADRVSTGMSHCYGKNIGRAVRVRPGQILMSVLVDEENVETAKIACKRAGSKLGVDIKVRVGTDVESIGTKPKKTRDIIAEEKKEEEVKAGAAKAEEEKPAEAKGGKKEEGKAAETKGGKPTEAKGGKAAEAKDAKKGDAKGKDAKKK